MKFEQQDQIKTFLSQSIHEFFYLCGKAWQALMQLQLPHLLLVCLGIALFIAILPMALSLFIAFMLLKLVVLVVAMAVRKNRQQPRQLP